MNKMLCMLVVIISAIGAINWGLVGLFNFDLVAKLFGEMTMVSRIVYVIVGVCGLIMIFGWKCFFGGSKCSDAKSS